MKLFIDTNIIFDYAFLSSPHHLPAKRLINQAPDLGHELISSSFAYLTAFYSLRKHLGIKNTALFLYQLSQRVIIKDAELSQKLQQNLLKVANAGSGDIEDLYQQDIAITFHADAIITRDQQFIKQSRKSGMPAYTPDTFLANE